VGFAPRANPFDLRGAALVVLIAGFSPPAGLAQRLAGLLALVLGAEPLVVMAPWIWQEQLLTAKASSASALAHHKARRCLPEPTGHDKKTRKKTRGPRRRTPKKQEPIWREAFEENRSRSWPPFTQPGLAPFQNAAGMHDWHL
jgi:hypothetical protein